MCVNRLVPSEAPASSQCLKPASNQKLINTESKQQQEKPDKPVSRLKGVDLKLQAILDEVVKQ